MESMTPYADRFPVAGIQPWLEVRRLTLTGDLHHALLADDHHLDLTGVVEILLDPLGHVAGHPHRAQIVYLVRFDRDPQFPSCLDGKAFLHSGKAVGDLLQRLQAFDVGAHRLAAGPRAGGGDRVGGGDQERLHRLRLLVGVVGGYRMDDLGRLPEPLADIGPDQGVRPLDLMVHRLANVVEEPRLLAYIHIGAHLGRHAGAEDRDLHRVVEYVLAVAGPVLQPAHQLHQIGMQAMDAGVKGRPLARLADRAVHFLAGLGHHFLDAGRMNPSIGDQLGQRYSRYLAANRVEAGENDRFRSIVDDQIDPGGRLQSPNVPALAPNDPALHLLVGEIHHRHRGFG